jgi:hypothetical protein
MREVYQSWKELASWLVAHAVTGGGEASDWHWLQLEDKGAETCKREGKLVVAVVAFVV